MPAHHVVVRKGQNHIDPSQLDGRPMEIMIANTKADKIQHALGPHRLQRIKSVAGTKYRLHRWGIVNQHKINMVSPQQRKTLFQRPTQIARRITVGTFRMGADLRGNGQTSRIDRLQSYTNPTLTRSIERRGINMPNPEFDSPMYGSNR